VALSLAQSGTPERRASRRAPDGNLAPRARAEFILARKTNTPAAQSGNFTFPKRIKKLCTKTVKQQ